MMIRTREFMMLVTILMAAGSDWSKPGLDVVDGLEVKPTINSTLSVTKTKEEFIAPSGTERKAKRCKMGRGKRKMNTKTHKSRNKAKRRRRGDRKAKRCKKGRGKRKMNTKTDKSRNKGKRRRRGDVSDIKLNRSGWPKDKINAVLGCRVRVRNDVNKTILNDTRNETGEAKTQRSEKGKYGNAKSIIKNARLNDTGVYGDGYLNVSEFRWKDDPTQFVKVRLCGTAVMEWQFETPSKDMIVYVHGKNRTNKNKYIAKVGKNFGNTHTNLTKSGEAQKVTFTIYNTTMEDLNFNYGITVQFSKTCVMVSALIKLIEDLDFVWLSSSDTVNIAFGVELFWSYKTQRSPTKIIFKRKSDIKTERVGSWTIAGGFQTEFNTSAIFSKTVVYNSNITDGFIYETVGLKLPEVNLEDTGVVYYCSVIYGKKYNRYTKNLSLIHEESTTIKVYDEVIPENNSLMILLLSIQSTICILSAVFLMVIIIIYFCTKYTGVTSKEQACQNQTIPASAHNKHDVTMQDIESVPFCKKLCWFGHYKMTQDEYHNNDDDDYEELL